MNEREIKERVDSIQNAWRRDDNEEREALNGTGETQETAKAKAAATDRKYQELAKPTKSKPLEPWQRETDVSDAPRTDARDDQIPAHIRAMCPPGRRPVKRADGGYTFELVNGTRADSRRETRQG